MVIINSGYRLRVPEQRLRNGEQNGIADWI